MLQPKAHATSPAHQDGLPAPQRVQAAFAIAAAIAMATLDTAITNTALPTIATDIGTDSATAIWIVSSYQIAVLAAILPLAALGDIVGHRKVYITGLVLFTLTSLACGLAWSLPSLVAARALQGLGAAAIMSVNTALLRYVYPSKMLGQGFGLNSLVVAMSFTIGPTVASLILWVGSWHWLFLINVPIGVAAIVLSLRNLPQTPRSAHGFQLGAAILSAGFFALLMLGINDASHQASWASVGVESLGSVVCLVLLIWWQRGHPAPMLAVDLFRRPVFALSAMTAVGAFAAQAIAFVALPFLLQTGLGRSQVETGFLMTSWPAVVALMGPIAGRLSDRYPPGILGGVGLMTMCIGMAALALMPADPSTADIVWRMALCGAGFGFFQSPNLKALITSAPAERAGGASGIVAAARLFGQTTGAALVALCFHLFSSDGSLLSLWLGCGFAALGSLASFLRLAAPSAARP
ncbi:DHA2 family multidrug resistance protein-like MFS transporter [Rhodoligotrophos appendicifer]|uniref:MFS transporter n=1 Tax=Rhodoligotrophos appendicifer TaxID=987056 RepID=UPI0011853A5B|nr:MFS transporter [Rhodoligotrophos appendicifer]